MKVRNIEIRRDRVDPPIVGHYHILDVRKLKSLAREKYMCMHGKISRKIHVRPFTIGYMCNELPRVCSDYDGGTWLILNMHFFLEARIFHNFDGS